MGAITLSDPVVVACSAPGEARWGHFQFPSLCRLPSGALLVTVHDAEDATAGYGDPLRRYISADEGQTWAPLHDAEPHACCAEVFDGEYLIVASNAAYDISGVALPAPAGVTRSIYGFAFSLYAVEACPAPLYEYLTRLPARRWTPARPAWSPEEVVYRIPGHLTWRTGNQPLIPHTWFEHAPLRHGDALLYIDYRSNCLLADGTAPDAFACLVMASHDNGRTFHLRGVAARGNVFEPALAEAADGTLVCVIRQTDHEQQPMLVTRSLDHGYTWEPPMPLFGFGVFPALTRLADGTLLLAFGRPGVWLSTSRDGRDWSDPVPVIAGDPAAIDIHTCGYTELLPLDDGGALLVYSDFQHAGPDGPCKSIEVRRVTVTIHER
jgi:hypothetical protein